ncbi:MAG: gliding motility-associated C-terminal domain-containing protein [Dysgonamonadaceae bacterium]|jgi:gliding motility-associated-like protein|nr:gliding motility-associated C-terminal domain-containing protein [Dysgonamonadaceae bacterium]
MKKAIVLILSFFGLVPVFSQYVVTGGTGQPLLAEENTAHNIQVYLLNGLDGAEISYTSTGTEAHQWSRYNRKAGEAEPVACRQTGNTSTISGLSDGFGYFVGDPVSSQTAYVWIIDYSKYVPVFSSFSFQEADDRCEFLKLLAGVEARPMDYFTGSGVRMGLQRTWHLLYDNLEWSPEDGLFAPAGADRLLRGTLSEIIIDAPLQSTSFTLKGDAYAEHFGLGREATTPVYEAIALEAHSSATVYKPDGTTEEFPAGSDIRTPAPVEIRFEAVANEPVAALYIWKITKFNPATGDSTAIVRYTGKSVTYKFEDSGIFTAQLEVINAQASCSDLSQVFKVYIEDSSLKLPNVFSPGSSIGSNDEYRVSYKSLISFKASIFNRWGNLLFRWTDPAKGWDGRVNGKYVPTGVYFIIVEAKGADGKSYKLSKDINVLRSAPGSGSR